MSSLLPAPLPASTPCCLAALDGLLRASHTAGLLAESPRAYSLRGRAASASGNCPCPWCLHWGALFQPPSVLGLMSAWPLSSACCAPHCCRVRPLPKPSVEYLALA